MNAGYDAKKSEIHGMSQRGGSVFSHIRYGEKVYSCVIPEGSADLIVALEEMEALRWTGYCSKATAAIITRTRINPANVIEYPAGISDELKRLFNSVMMVEPVELAAKSGGQKFLNTALLGVVSLRVNFPELAWREAIDKLTPAGTAEQNWKAFQMGRELDHGGAQA